MEKELKFYEKKILNDKEFPIQLHINRVHEKRWYFSPHWHEHIELHYVVSGRTKFLLDQQEIPGEKGDLVIANSNVIHAGYCYGSPVEVLVMIFEMEALSEELADKNILFQPWIKKDAEIGRIMHRIYEENEKKDIGYKLACKGGLLQIITYLSRNYVQEMLSNSDSLKRRKKLDGVQTVQRAEEIPAPAPEGADIMDMKTEKSLELRRDVRKFAEENPEIAAQMVKNWLREGDDAG